MSPAARKLKLEMPVVRTELRCGATLLVSPRPGAPIAAAQVHVRGGGALDPAGKEGTAYYAGAFADQGTGTRSDEDIARLLEPEGGGIQGDAGGLYGAVAGDAWGMLMDVLGDLVADASYPDDRLARHFGRMKTRLAVEAEDPRSQGGILMKKLVFGEEERKKIFCSFFFPFF